MAVASRSKSWGGLILIETGIGIHDWSKTNSEQDAFRVTFQAMDEEDIAAPSDWKDTALSVLIPLDSNLRCLICKDYYTAPVITTCLHTFCSLCIRRCLSVDSICPACRTTNISDSGLRQNKVVADLVENFLTARYRSDARSADVDHVY